MLTRDPDAVSSIRFKTIPQGAATSCYVGTSPSLGCVTGFYFSDCSMAIPLPTMQDNEKARHLWQVSEDLTSDYRRDETRGLLSPRENLVELGRILHTRQLHDDPINTLPLHERFGNAETVHAIPERHHVLLDREILSRLDLGLAHPNVQRTTIGRVRYQHVRIGLAKYGSRHLEIVGRLNMNADYVAVEVHTIPDTHVAQRIDEVLLIGLETVVDSVIQDRG